MLWALIFAPGGIVCWVGSPLGSLSLSSELSFSHSCWAVGPPLSLGGLWAEGSKDMFLGYHKMVCNVVDKVWLLGIVYCEKGINPDAATVSGNGSI